MKINKKKSSWMIIKIRRDDGKTVLGEMSKANKKNPPRDQTGRVNRPTEKT